MTTEAMRKVTSDALCAIDADPDALRALALALSNERRHVDARLERFEVLHQLAAKTRAAQRRYFASRTPANLCAAKALEDALDQLLDPAPMLPGMEATR
ncbi:MAG TPA: hypothetical protein VN033_08870 [Vulgatibacter sp.]|nr:hypothetical protein [Vulgatibacter sp.]